MMRWSGNDLQGRREDWQGELADYQQWIHQGRPTGVGVEVEDEERRRRGLVTEAWQRYQHGRAGRGMTVQEEQQGARESREHVERWNRGLRSFTNDRLGTHPPMPLPLDTTARQVASMGTAAQNAAGALNRLYAVVDQLVTRLSPAGHQASTGYRLDLNPGGALGARLLG